MRTCAILSIGAPLFQAQSMPLFTYSCIQNISDFHDLINLKKYYLTIHFMLAVVRITSLGTIGTVQEFLIQQKVICWNGFG